MVPGLSMTLTGTIPVSGMFSGEHPGQRQASRRFCESRCSSLDLSLGLPPLPISDAFLCAKMIIPDYDFFLRRAFDWVVKSGGYPGKESVNFLQKRVNIQSFDSWKGIAQMQNGKLYE